MLKLIYNMFSSPTPNTVNSYLFISFSLLCLHWYRRSHYTKITQDTCKTVFLGLKRPHEWCLSLEYHSLNGQLSQKVQFYLNNIRAVFPDAQLWSHIVQLNLHIQHFCFCSFVNNMDSQLPTCKAEVSLHSHYMNLTCCFHTELERGDKDSSLWNAVMMSLLSDVETTQQKLRLIQQWMHNHLEIPATKHNSSRVQRFRATSQQQQREQV